MEEHLSCFANREERWRNEGQKHQCLASGKILLPKDTLESHQAATETVPQLNSTSCSAHHLLAPGRLQETSPVPQRFTAIKRCIIWKEKLHWGLCLLCWEGAVAVGSWELPLPLQIPVTMGENVVLASSHYLVMTINPS